MSKINDCIKFFGAIELTLRGHDVCDDSLNTGIYRCIIDLMGSLDSIMKDNIENNNVFKLYFQVGSKQAYKLHVKDIQGINKQN